MPLKPRDDGSGKLQTGRPTKYRPEYCDDIINWFNRPLTDDNGKPCKIPLKTDWALEKKISRQSLYQWIDDYPEFSDAVKTCEDILKSLLINNTLHGHYNPTAFIFTAKNLTDMRDVQETTTNVNINIADYLTQIPDRTIDANYQVIDNKKPGLS